MFAQVLIHQRSILPLVNIRPRFLFHAFELSFVQLRAKNIYDRNDSSGIKMG